MFTFTHKKSLFSLAFALSGFMYFMASGSLYAGGSHSCLRAEDEREHRAVGTSSALPDYREIQESPFFYTKTPLSTGYADRVMAYSQPSAAMGAPLSIVHNTWPEEVRNESLFSYLVPHDGSAATYPEFCTFVRTYYKSSCAIVYYPSGEDFSVMLGSGGLVRDYNTIATARHVIEGLDRDRLCVRFYDYRINETEDPERFLIQGQYLDVKLTSIQIARGGLDACWLKLSRVSEEFKNKYMQPIAMATSPLRGTHIIPMDTMLCFILLRQTFGFR